MIPDKRTRPSRGRRAFDWTCACLLWVAGVGTLACGGPKEGDACSTAAEGARCLDAKVALMCQEERLVRFPCKGPSGCAENAEGVRCDSTLAEETDRCEEGSFTCRVDGKARLKCINGRYALESQCLGDDGCSVAGSVASCDTSKAELGDACEDASGVACSIDGTTMLLCEGRWIEGSKCRKGCRRRGSAQTGLVECEEELARRLGPCAPEGALACEKDGKSLVTCRSGRYQPTKTCTGEKGCVASGFAVECHEAPTPEPPTP